MEKTRLKLEALDTPNPLIIQRQQEQFLQNLDKEGITILQAEKGDDDKGALYEEPGCQPTREFTYQVGRNDGLGEALLRAVRSFLRWQSCEQMPSLYRGVVVLTGTEAFVTEVVPVMENMRTMALYFGNIQGGVLLSHWEVSFSRDGLNIETNSEEILSNFYFDRGRILQIEFKTKEFATTNEGRKDTTGFYELAINRKDVRRVIVDIARQDYSDPEENDDDEKARMYSVVLHFELQCPVEIQHGFWFKDKERSQGKNFSKPRMERFYEIRRGRFPTQTSHKSAIADSPFFSVELDPRFCVSDAGRKKDDGRLLRLLSRIRQRVGIPLEFGRIEIVDALIGTEKLKPFMTPYFSWMSPDQRKNMDKCQGISDKFVKDAIRRSCVGEEGRDRRRFALMYLFECLLSRGAIVKDQLCIEQLMWTRFVKMVCKQAKRNFERCELALEHLVVLIDQRKRFGDVAKAFHDEYEQLRAIGMSEKVGPLEAREGYQRVRKVIVTPTRTIYVVPEMMMSNRVLRKRDPQGIKVLRVTFRDDNNAKMRERSTGEKMDHTVLDAMANKGLKVGGCVFGYLGSSNSQMRDNGAYFMTTFDPKKDRDVVDKSIPPGPQIIRVRNQLGKFNEIASVPKMMARLGQCFTQSRCVSTSFCREKYSFGYEVIGGANQCLTPYTYSDGVGMMSLELAREVGREMNFGKGLPSSFQFRYRGMKGMLSVEPLLDEIWEWAVYEGIEREKEERDAENGDEDVNKKYSWHQQCIFRESQTKFDAPRSSSRKGAETLEVVKFSAPVPVCLNKPFINILDQVSEMQSLACHQRVTNRIEELLDRQMRGFAASLLDEHECRNRLKELPRRVDVDNLTGSAGFQLVNEPFFRSMVKAKVKYAVCKSLKKEQIQIPFELGRSMLGVIDETGRLQYGQVFVHYTKSIREKVPGPRAAKNVVVGPILLTKNPCNVAGDVRIFEGVDIPELRHLVDVIVFPQHGPRPHPDEMAGSDLDGDEYTVIWDEELLLERNEPAFDFTAPKMIDVFKTDKERENAMCHFYLTYMKQDSVGTISNAFLHASDLYGINSKVCLNLARKASQAVDFTKSGIPPEPLVKDWVVDSETGGWIPPEKSERVPDYHVDNDHKPIYRSPRLIGSLYREIKTVEDVIRLADAKEDDSDVVEDEYLVVPGWEYYEQTAERELNKYNGRIRALMANYGIATEGELFSGAISDMRNRISDKDQDDMSFFNTDQLIETRVTSIFRRFREAFFEEFNPADGDGWRQLTEKVDRPFADEDNICHRYCKHPHDELKKKASAYYVVAYRRARTTKERKLSFGWLAFDVLSNVRQQRCIQEQSWTITSNPLYQLLDEQWIRLMEVKQAEFDEFSRFDDWKLFGGALRTIKLYTRTYKGLDRVMWMLVEWAKKTCGPSGSLGPAHLGLLLIMFTTNHFAPVTGTAHNIINPLNQNQQLNEISDADQQELPNPSKVSFSKKSSVRSKSASGVPRLCGYVDMVAQTLKSWVFCQLMEFLASRRFRKLPFLSFQSVGFSSVFLRGEWIPLHRAAVKTYYNMVLNLSMEDFPEGRGSNLSQVKLAVMEHEPFVIELPETVDDDVVRDQLLARTGLEDIQLRRLLGGTQFQSPGRNKKKHCRVSVLCRGHLESYYRLRDLVTVTPQVKNASRGKEVADELIQLVYEKIMGEDV